MSRCRLIKQFLAAICCMRRVRRICCLSDHALCAENRDQVMGWKREHFLGAESEQLSRTLAGQGFLLSRKEFLSSSSSFSLSQEDNIYGVGICTTWETNEEVKEQHFVSIWDWKSVTTYKRSNISFKELSIFLDELEESPSQSDPSIVYSVSLEEEIQKVLDGASSFLVISASGDTRTYLQNTSAILSGSFNPLHRGHVGMLEKSVKHYCPSVPSYFELSIHNADKPPLDMRTILNRAAQFAGRYDLILSSVPFFIDKAKLFAPATFIVGYDTAQRIVNKKYYQESNSLMYKELESFQKNQCNFLVCGRTIDNTWNLDLPTNDKTKTLFSFVPQQIFHDDISSTEMRNKGIKVPF